mmetsp:Transcript_76629/g.228384  ORF Transcript_76629/g.228384 Transcript_76629/m.228384 type:complete len:290 (+) Transcript_76629:120-989(+)
MVANLLARTPLGNRVVYGLCIGAYALYVLDHHVFVSLDLTCRPADVIYGMQVQRLLLASFTHTSLLGLCFALAVSWRRFAWLEHEYGTLGFLLWFAWCSLLLHGIYCLVYVLLAAIFGFGVAGSEVHGLFPLLVASLALSMHSSDASEVWLWPLPLHVSVKVLPPIVIALAWLLHWEAHYDVAVAYAVARIAPWLVEPDALILAERAEQTPWGRWILGKLQNSDAFVCRPPFLSSEDPAEAPSAAKPKTYHGTPDGMHGLGPPKDQQQSRPAQSMPEPLPYGYVDEAML